MENRYSYEYAKFPKYGLIDITPFKNVDATVLPLINQINALIRSDDQAAASELISQNAELLKPYFSDATTPNRIMEEVQNTQIKALEEKQSIYYQDEEPIVHKDMDVWIGGDEDEN